MSYAEKIGQAISAHAHWKLRLKTAIDTGKSEWTVDRVSPDNLCEFGQWLYSLPANVRQTRHWVEVQALHATFHKEAARILGLALHGDRKEASQLMAYDSPFARLSAGLTWALMEWRKTFAAASQENV
ncbi:MAG: CZB domain-containing protein [Gammaproteobacteria bacterium]|nr:CZB domain-containing protein [Gammaproteobacteria bacterium]